MVLFCPGPSRCAGPVLWLPGRWFPELGGSVADPLVLSLLQGTARGMGVPALLSRPVCGESAALPPLGRLRSSALPETPDWHAPPPPPPGTRGPTVAVGLFFTQ